MPQEMYPSELDCVCTTELIMISEIEHPYDVRLILWKTVIVHGTNIPNTASIIFIADDLVPIQVD